MFIACEDQHISLVTSLELRPLLSSPSMKNHFPDKNVAMHTTSTWAILKPHKNAHNINMGHFEATQKWKPCVLDVNTCNM